MDGKWVCINDGQPVVRVNIAQILPDMDDEDDRDNIKLLQSIRQFKTGRPAGVLTKGVLAPYDARS